MFNQTCKCAVSICFRPIWFALIKLKSENRLVFDTCLILSIYKSERMDIASSLIGDSGVYLFSCSPYAAHRSLFTTVHDAHAVKTMYATIHRARSDPLCICGKSQTKYICTHNALLDPIHTYDNVTHAEAHWTQYVLGDWR